MFCLSDIKVTISPIYTAAHSMGRLLTLIMNIRQKIAKDKHASLLRPTVGEVEKWFLRICHPVAPFPEKNFFLFSVHQNAETLE